MSKFQAIAAPSYFLYSYFAFLCSKIDAFLILYKNVVFLKYRQNDPLKSLQSGAEPVPVIYYFFDNLNTIFYYYFLEAN